MMWKGTMREVNVVGISVEYEQTGSLAVILNRPSNTAVSDVFPQWGWQSAGLRPEIARSDWIVRSAAIAALLTADPADLWAQFLDHT